MFKNTITSIEQEFLKVELRNYFREIDLIRILDAKLKETCQLRVSIISFSLAKDTKVLQIQENK